MTCLKEGAAVRGRPLALRSVQPPGRYIGIHERPRRTEREGDGEMEGERREETRPGRI